MNDSTIRLLLDQLRILRRYEKESANLDLEFILNHSRAITQVCEELMGHEVYEIGSPSWARN